MKKRFFCFAVLSILSFNSQAQVLTKEQIQDDFEYFKNALAEGHPGLYWYNTKKTLDQVSQNVASKLNEINNTSELYSSLVEIVNTISCGHTAVLLPESHYQKVDSINQFIPFNVVLREGKVIVAESFTKKLVKGDQVLSINGESIDKVISELEHYIPIDKGIQTKRERSIEIVFPYYFAVFKGSPGVFEIDYKSRKGKKLQAHVVAIGLNENMYKSVRDFAPAQVPIAWTIDKTESLATLKIATFGPQSFKKNQLSFQDTIKGIFKEIADKNVNNLIIDLRWNNGGSMRLAEYLFSFFIDSSNLFYKDAEIKQAVMEGTTKYARSRNMKPMMEKQLGPLVPENGVYYLLAEKFRVEPSAPQYRGKLYLLTNGFSFSASSAFIAGIQQNDLGEVIGETPGGAFDAVNAGPPMLVELPNSKIRLYYRIIGTKYNVDDGKTQATVDVKIDNTITGFMEGKDEQMDHLKEQILKH